MKINSYLCKIIKVKNNFDMETTMLNTALANYFAQKVDKGFDEIISDGSISIDTIEQWGKEHMRTPY